MAGYIGTLRQNIEGFIGGVQEKGVAVRRENRVKRTSVLMRKSCIAYFFSKDSEKLFALYVVLLDEGKNIEMLIKQDDSYSDTVREGDDGYRKACVLYQLAEKMYQQQRVASMKAHRNR